LTTWEIWGDTGRFRGDIELTHADQLLDHLPRVRVRLRLRLRLRVRVRVRLRLRLRLRV
jgi:hypothetical protein